MSNNYLVLLCFFLFSQIIQTQEEVKSKKENIKHSPYELLTSYYNTDFQPFNKGNIYFGFSMALEDRQMENTDNLFQKVLDGDRVNFNILLKGGYYLNDYTMLGLNANIFENKFEGVVLRDSDTIQSKSIKRGYSFTPNYRTSIPLTKNERLSFFTSAGLTFGKSSTLKRDVKNLDEIEKSFSDNYNLRLGISPGVTFFAMENFALEVQLDVLGYEMNLVQKTVNGEEESRDIRHNVDFNINILSMKLGVAYYFGNK